jgi:hypothetical protein
MRRLLWLTVLLAACDLPTGSLPPRSVPFSGAAPVPNTTIVRTFLTEASNGRPVSTVALLAVDSAGRRVGVRLGPSGGAAVLDTITVTSDTNGVAAVAVAFGMRAGRAVIIVDLPALGVRGSLAYDLTGGTVGHLLASAVTPGYVGDTLLVSWVTYDASWVPEFGTPALSLLDTSVVEFVADDHVRAKKAGSTWVRITQDGQTDSALITVVPPGTLNCLVAATWERFDLNGVTQRALFRASSAFSHPRSSPSGDTLAYGDSGHVRLKLPGNAVVRVVPAALGFVEDREPAWSPDGTWLYFTARYADGRSEIWRIHPDGSGAALAGPAAAVGIYDGEPTVSADGSLLAFTTNRTLAGGQNTLLVVNLGNATAIYTGPAAAAPVFAPSGTRLAYLSSGHLVLVNGDGSGPRTLTANDARYFGQLAWSPDGRWIAVDHPGPAGPVYLHLVDTVADLAIRLPYAFNFQLPDWR